MKASPPARFEEWLGVHPDQAQRFHLASKALGAVIEAFRRDMEGAGGAVGETTLTLPAYVWGRADEPGSQAGTPPGWQEDRGLRLVRAFEALSPLLAQAWASHVLGWAACFRWRATVLCEVCTVRVAFDRAGAALSEREISGALALSLFWLEFERESEQLIEDYEAGITRLLEGVDDGPAGVH